MAHRITPRIVPCKICGKDYEKVWANQQYCGSRSQKIGCSYKAMQDKFSRWLKNNPEKTLVRYSSIKPAKVKAKERDNNTCQMCGLFNGIPKFMDVDHKDGNRYNNILVNLWTLCPNCHRLKTLKNGDNLAR